MAVWCMMSVLVCQSSPYACGGPSSLLHKRPSLPYSCKNVFGQILLPTSTKLLKFDMLRAGA